MTTWSRPARNAKLAVTLAVAFGASAAFSAAVTRESNGVEALWLATGFLAAGFLLLDRAWAIGLAVVCVVINVSVFRSAGDPIGVALTFSILNFWEALLTAWLARFACGARVRLTSMDRVSRLLLMAVAPASAAGSLLAANLWAVFGRSFDGVLASCFFADALGMALVLPAVLMMNQGERGPAAPWWERLGILAALGGLTALVFSYTAFPLQLLLFPAAILAAFRLGGRGAAQGSLIIAAVGLSAMIMAPVSGLNPSWTMPERIRGLQFLVALVFFSSLVTAMALGGQQRLKLLWAGRTRLARRSQARAREAGEAKAQFLATVSHEIRTPMNSIVGFAELLLKRDDLAAGARRQIDLVAQAGALLLASVDDVLSLSTIEAGDVQLTPRPYSARNVAQDALAIVNPAAKTKNLALDLTVGGGGDELVMLDDLRVRQVLLNLLSNAVKFTETGRVRLDVGPATYDGARWVRFTVTDTGIGVAEEKVPQLFQPFCQLDASTTRAFPGAGVGLAIARMLVEAMGGRIGFERGSALGSVFWFEIPAPCAAAAEPSPQPRGLEARVLLVDDHEANRELGLTVLRLLGCEVETARDGREAVAAAQTGVYDVILMDIHMPRMDGLEAARAIRALGGDIGRTPIIAMSADVMPDTTARCLKAGMDDALGKPIQIAALHAALSKWIGKLGGADAAAAAA